MAYFFGLPVLAVEFDLMGKIWFKTTRMNQIGHVNSVRWVMAMYHPSHRANAELTIKINFTISHLITKYKLGGKASNTSIYTV